MLQTQQQCLLKTRVVLLLESPMEGIRGVQTIYNALHIKSSKFVNFQGIRSSRNWRFIRLARYDYERGGGGVTVSASTNIRHHMPSCPKFPTLENLRLIPTSMDLHDRADLHDCCTSDGSIVNNCSHRHRSIVLCDRCILRMIQTEYIIKMLG